ncbi:uncharacterized protein LTR77_004607 [Saxophila tyrrhenica]|uniref:Cytochrome b561 domain-containing protein n=1 Tax=Saxophila tyrrhenica TaxID=1690608 RepID=A0AAV9PGM3_9PEZI|nr:hypothetical protein LTR77_004607 [Saxophila tyrrhenica]
MRFAGATILALPLWIAGIEANYGIDYDAKASYFNFQVNGNSLYVFALNVVADTGDIYFHMSGPVLHTWLGIGFGSSMKDAFMIVAYPSDNGLDTTISTRLGSGHTEPVWTSGYEIQGVFNDTYAPNANKVTDDGTGVIIAHSVCRNCTKWPTGSLDLENIQQPMIFALGPQKQFRSDSVEASIPRHALYGQFTTDMTKATNYSGWYGRVPAPNVPDFVFPPDDTAFATFGTAPPYNVDTMNNPMPTAHAVLMCFAFVILFPAGALVMQFLKKTLWHAAIQSIGFVAVLGGFGVAINVARQYNKSKNYSSGHQVLGLIVLAGLFIQLGLGLVHHSIYVRTKKPTPIGRIHFFLGPSIMLLGLINGGVGFNFAHNHRMTIPYAIVVVAIILVCAGVGGCVALCRNRRKYKPEREPYPHPNFGQQPGYTDYELPRQPTFGEQPPEPYEPPTPYSPIGHFEIESPYTPSSAYTPVTPKTWRKEDITNWPQWPHHKEDEWR